MNNNNNNNNTNSDHECDKTQEIYNDTNKDNVILTEIPIGKEFNLDDYLIEIGGLKKFQLVNFCIVGSVMFLASALSLTYVFTAGDLNYRCVIPECDKGQSEYNPDWLMYAVPFEDDSPVQCEMFKLVVNETLGDDGFCSADNFNRHTKVTCSEFIYETEERTIVNEWNITCNDQKWKLSLAGSIEIAGAFFGLPLAGYVSDMYGRRFSFIAGMMGSALFGTIRSFSWNYESFLVFEFFDPLFGAGVFPSVYILAIELVGPKYRVLFGAIINICFAIGEIILGLVAMLALDWRLLLRILYIPAFLFIFYLWLTPESVRWLLIKGKNEKAVKVLRKAAKVNKARLSPQTEQDLQDLEQRKLGLAGENEESSTESNTYNLMDIFKYPTILMRIANCSFSWFAITFVYFGLSLISTSIGGDKFVNFILVCAIEIPANVMSWYMNERIGRKMTLCISMIVSGLSCIGSTFIKDNQVVNLVLFLIGKFGISISFATIYIYTTEMFPTNLRQSLLSICSTIGRLGNILAPQTPLLSIVFTDLPMYCFGGVVLASGLCGLYFPETLNKQLPDTLEEAVALNSTVPKKIDDNK